MRPVRPPRNRGLSHGGNNCYIGQGSSLLILIPALVRYPFHGCRAEGSGFEGSRRGEREGQNPTNHDRPLAPFRPAVVIIGGTR